jgi:WD40 repeat protein
MLLIAAVCAKTDAAQAEASDTVTPILTINTQTHSAPVFAVDTDAAGQRVVTAGVDGTARVWSLPQGRLLRILRAPIISSAAQSSGIEVTAMSPDGKIVAVSGESIRNASTKTFDILLFDASTGAVIRQLPGVDGRPRALAFSPDGAYLVAALTFHGISAWRTSTWEVIHTDSEDRKNMIMSMVFNRDGLLATADLTDKIQIYDRSLKPIIGVMAAGANPGRTQRLTLAFSGSGTQLAVGRESSLRIDILATKDLSTLSTINPAADGNPGDAGRNIASVSRLAWSADDRHLYATGFNRDGSGHISAWDESGRGGERVVPVSAAMPITGIRALRNGGVAFTAQNAAWGVVDAGANSFDRPSELPDFRDGQQNFRVSEDGLTVSFGLLRHGGKPVVFSLVKRSLAPVSSPPPELVAAGGESTNGYPSRSYSIAAGSRVLTGGSASFGLTDASGQRLWYRNAPHSVEMANLAGNGRLVVTANADGTIRWYRGTDGQELFALYVHPDARRWVLWTPSGYYDAAPDSEDLIGWLIGHGPGAPPDFYPASRFADSLRRPDVLSQLLKTFDETQAVRLANAQSDRKDQQMTPGTLATQLPPTLQLVSAPTRFDTDSVSISYRIDTHGDAQIVGEPRIKINGQWQPASRTAERNNAGVRQLTVSGLPAHDTTVEMYADNAHGTSPALVIPLFWDGRASLAPGQQGTAAAAKKPRLYVLAVGISQYARPNLRLAFADHDAQNFAAAMQAQQGKAYESVDTKLLVNGDASRSAVQSGLTWLQSHVTGTDIGILFLAGHGFQTPDQNYFFAPAEFDPDHPRETGVDYRMIRTSLMTFAGAGNKAIFLIDTCYSGGAVGGNLSASNGETLAATLGRAEYGVAALTAARADQLSFEDAKWGDGAFTKALLEGIVEAKADPEASGTITVLDLGRYVSKRVPVMTEKRQAPVLIMPAGGFEDFTLATR